MFDPGFWNNIIYALASIIFCVLFIMVDTLFISFKHDKIDYSDALCDSPSLCFERACTLLDVSHYSESTLKQIEEEIRKLFESEKLRKLMHIVSSQLTDQEKNEQKYFTLLKTLRKVSHILYRKNYFSKRRPARLKTLLSLVRDNENIMSDIEASTLSSKEKSKLKKLIYACSNITQIGSILLVGSGINAKIALSREHVFLYFPINKQEVLFIDFSCNFFEKVKIDDHYHRKWPILYLKEKNIIPVYDNLRLTQEQSAIFTTYSNYSFIYRGLGNTKKEASLLEKSVNMYSQLYEAIINMGCAYHDSNKPGEAIERYSLAIFFNPECDVAYYNRGIAYVNCNDTTNAINDLSRAIEMNPKFYDAYYNRAMVHLLRDEFSEASRNAKELIRLKREDFAKDLFEKIAKCKISRTNSTSEEGLIIHYTITE